MGEESSGEESSGEECGNVGRGIRPWATGLSLALALSLAPACGRDGPRAEGSPRGEEARSEAVTAAQQALRERFAALVEAQAEDEEAVHELGELLDALGAEDQLELAAYAAKRELPFRQVAVDLFLRHERREEAVELIVDGLTRGEDLLSVVVFSRLHTDPEAAGALLAAVREEVAARRPEMTPEEIAAVERLLDS